MNDEPRTAFDASLPTLLLVCFGGVLVAVVGIIAVGLTSATAVLLAAIVVLLCGTALVTLTIGRQLEDADGRAADHRGADDRRQRKP